MRHPNVSPWLALVLLTGCGAVLGIDDAHVDSTFHPGAGGVAGAAATGGSGGSSSGGAAGTSAAGGGDGGAQVGGNGPGGAPAGTGGMGPGPGMGGMGGMVCGTNTVTPVMNGGAIVVHVVECSGKTGPMPQLRIAAHPNNNAMMPPNMPPFMDNMPVFPETGTLTPGDGTYVIDAVLDFLPYITPPNMPSASDASAVIAGVAVAGPNGADVTLFLH